jgi:hypothetical protein
VITINWGFFSWCWEGNCSFVAVDVDENFECDCGGYFSKAFNFWWVSMRFSQKKEYLGFRI